MGPPKIRLHEQCLLTDFYFIGTNCAIKHAYHTTYSLNHKLA